MKRIGCITLSFERFTRPQNVLRGSNINGNINRSHNYVTRMLAQARRQSQLTPDSGADMKENGSERQSIAARCVS
jgi:hypothetical protein